MKAKQLLLKKRTETSYVEKHTYGYDTSLTCHIYLGMYTPQNASLWRSLAIYCFYWGYFQLVRQSSKTFLVIQLHRLQNMWLKQCMTRGICMLQNDKIKTASSTRKYSWTCIAGHCTVYYFNRKWEITVICISQCQLDTASFTPVDKI